MPQLKKKIPGENKTWPRDWEVSSVGSERLVYTQEAKVYGGSNPSSPTNPWPHSSMDSNEGLLNLRSGFDSRWGYYVKNLTPEIFLFGKLFVHLLCKREKNGYYKIPII